VVSIGIAAPTSAPIYLADSLGYFEQQGLNVEVKLVPNAYLSLAAGQIQYGLVGISQVITLDTEIQDPVVITTGYIQVFFVRAESQAIPGSFNLFFIQEPLAQGIEQLDGLGALTVVGDGHETPGPADLEV